MTDQIQGYRLSPVQRRAWSLASSDGSLPRVSATVEVGGPLDLDRLRGALAAVIERHEILRTRFQRVAGMAFPLQVVAPTAPAVVRVGADAATDADADAAVIATVTALAADRHVLTVAVAAACADAAGLEHLIGELARAYAGAPAATDAADLLQYAVVSDWLNDTLEADDADAGKRFWQTQVAELTAAVPARADGASRAGRVAVALEPGTAAALEGCAARLGASPASVVAAAWRALIVRVVGAGALPIAVRADGRATPELAEGIGPIARDLPVVAAIDGGARFADVVARVEAATAEATAWQECYDAQALLTGDAGPRCLPYVVGYRAGHAVHVAGATTFRVVDVDAQLEACALFAGFVRTADGLDAQLRYDRGRFTAAEAERLAARLRAVIASALADPDAQIADLRVLPADEERVVTVDFNATAASYPGPQLLHRVFEAQVARTPQRVAVAFGDQTLTYRQLDAYANQLARRLRRAGVDRNVPVGLLMERSLDMVVGILGILKAGGAYIPLDAEYPADRLAYMLADAQVSALVTHDRLAAGLIAPPATIVRLDTDWADIAREDAEPLAGTSDPEDLAYVLYTSGSTGRPKGVMIPHRALCNHMAWMQAQFPLAETDSVLQKTPFSFDASVWEFYAPLFAGGRLVMAQPGGHRDAEYLCDTIVREGITTIQLVPTLLRMLLEQPAFARCTSLTRVYCGGEALAIDLRDRLHQVSTAALINLYGPTETCIDATFHVCARGEAGVPIGRPIANTQIYLLDERRRPVPVGVAGELYIGGAGVGLGYLHNPTLSAERFLADPFTPGGRLYRTGDLGRFAATGAIEYLGRIDNQIKLRGHRIELGEIEATLARVPDVAACVVVVREDHPGDRRLAAYYVARAGATPRSAELRAALKDQLPEYMVPPDFVRLDALPLLPNGKVDQRALPAPTVDADELADSYVAPRNAIEHDVAQIWMEVLGVSQVGIHDDFFALGGHSLIATQLTSRIRKRFHVDLPLRELFAAPTVLGLAERIAALQGELAEHQDVAAMLAELEGLSDEDARALLTTEPSATAAG